MADDFNLLNAQADQIWDASVRRYNQAPNPQLAADALQVGAGTDVAAAIGGSNPSSSTDSLAGIATAGPDPNSDGSFTAPRAKVLQSQTTPWTMDREAYKTAQQEIMLGDQGLANTFKDVKGVPVANVQFAQDTVYWAQKDSKQAAAWQQHMIDSGVYTSADGLLGTPGGRSKADGRWTDADTQAMYLYLAHIGTPDAMFGSPDRKSNATTAVGWFYNQLGFQWSPDGMNQALAGDPKKAAEYKDMIFNDWMASHPYKKDDGGAMQDRLNEYINLYGKDSLPPQYQSLAGGDGGFLGKVWHMPGNLLGTGAGALSGLEDTITNHIFGQGNLLRNPTDAKVAQGIKSGGVGGALSDYLATPTVRSMALSSQFSDAEKANLAPLIGKVAANSDYLSEAGNWWSHQTTKLQLSTIYGMGDLFSGKDFSSNPFDNLARAWSGGTAHEDNFMVGLAGQQWVKDHSSWASTMNIASSFIDPTVFVGAAGRLATSGGIAKQLERASALSKDALVKNGVAISSLDRLRYVVAPTNTMKRIRDSAIKPLIRNAANPHDVMTILGARSPESRKLVMDLLHDESGKFKEQIDDVDLQHIIDTNFDHVAHAGATFYNFRQSLKMMSPNVIRRMDGNKIVRAMTMGAWDFGHRSMNFELDPSTAVEKMLHEAALFKMPEAETNDLISRLMADTTGSVDVAAEFYQRLDGYIPKAVKDAVLAGRKSEWDGQVPDLVAHQYAVDPKGPISATGTGELSTAPVKVPSRLQNAYDAMQQSTSAIQADFMSAVKQYQEGLGFGMGGSKDANAPIVQRFLDDPANKAIADKYMKDKADIEKEMSDLLGSSTGTRGAPMLEQQLQKLYHAPYSTWELILATHGKLGKVDAIERMAKMDAIMDMWKLFTLAKPSSALRALVGDDSARVAVTLALAGSAKAAAQESVIARITAQPLTLVESAWYLLSPMGHGIFGVSDHLRGLVMTKVRQATGMTKEEAELASKGWYDSKAEYLGALVPDVHKMAEMSDHSAGFHPVGPGQPGHDQALQWWVRAIGNGPGAEWAKIYDEKGAAAAEQFLVTHRTTNLSEGNLKLAVAKGATKADRKTMEMAQQHADMSQQLKDLLAAKDASMPKYMTGPRAGQPNYKAAEYKQAYLGLPGMNTPGFKGSYRDRLVARQQYHDHMSSDFPQIVLEQARQEHQFYEQFAGMPEIRDMLKKGMVNSKKLKAIVKNPESRAKLPWVVATEDTAMTRGFKHAVQAPARPSMSHVFRPIITAGRAQAMQGVLGWWKNYLKEFYKDSPSWDASRINNEALGMAQDWMRNNTYQGARTIGSYALRNVFPFSGSVMNQDQFWMKTFKAHPWTAGVAAKLGITADQHRHDQFDIPNPLGWAHVAGDTLHINPWGWTFIGSEGMGSAVPGMGPFAMPFATIAAQNATAKQVIDMVPGWGAYLPPDASASSIAGGFIPSYLRKPVVAAGMAAGFTPPTAEKMIADRTKVDEAMGQRPTEDQVRREVEIELASQGVASWVLPFQPSISNKTLTMIKKSAYAESQGQTLTQLAQDPAYKDIQPYLQYRDPATDPATKDQIAQQYPQVLAWAAGTHETKGVLNMPKPTSYADFTQMSTAGDEHFMGAGEIDQEIHQSLQTSQFFQAYDQAYKPIKDQWLSDNPDTSTSSQDYKDFKVASLDPIMQRMQELYPLGYEKFIGGSTSLSTLKFTNAIGNLNTFFHMPQTAELDSSGVNNWRTVTDLANQAVTNIVDAKNSGASAADLQLLADDFHRTLIQQFQGDPTFLDEIGARYHWSQWQHFLSSTANQQIQQANQ